MDKKKTTIFLIAGHHRAGVWPTIHRSDPGGIPRYPKNIKFDPPVYNEHHECEKIVTLTYEILRQQGYTVWICPFRYNLKAKIDWAKKLSKENDLVISVHMDTGPIEATGCSVWYLSGNNRELALSKSILKILSDTMSLKDRGAVGDKLNRLGRLAICRDIPTTSLLVEMGFITNPIDMRKVRDFGPQALADAIKSIVQ